MITLLVLQGPDKGRRFELPDQNTLIGRESRALPLNDQTTSRRHAELRPEDDGQWRLVDLGSSNGTYVNGQRVEQSQMLKMGDQIRVGRSLLVVGIQPGVQRQSGANVSLMGAESGMDSSIINTLPSNDDSMVMAVPEPAAAAIGNLKILYRLSAALGSSFDIDQVLEVIMDLVFEHVKADRGIIMLLDKEQNPIPKVVRVRDETRASGTTGRAAVETTGDGTKPEPEKINASWTIIKYVIDSGSGVLSSNAMVDPRFSKGKSVHNLGIRSALCVPIKARKLDHRVDDAGNSDEVVGVIYIDSSVRNYTYSTDQLRLLTAIGLQAGLAIQNAKLYQAGLEAERLAAIGETTAALSHSIKNILQALRGGADVVEMGIRRTDLNQLGKGWRIVDRNLEKIYNLTMNLLAYSHARQPKLEMVNPKKVIEECLELIAPMANEKGVMAVADVDNDLPAIPMDPDGLHQAIMNLLTNALDAAEAQEGLIRVTCKFDSANKSTIIEIIDNGQGIAPSMMPHLFEIFHSTKGNRGTGLGLAVAKKIVTEHEGVISASSGPEGTTFTIRLPTTHLNLTDAGQTYGPAVQ
ncbi:MAG: FHA domain-containing protein [Burkholderiales bacterium]|nr:FHA domain-containing protein [Phycisphaerae bacterium]